LEDKITIDSNLVLKRALKQALEKAYQEGLNKPLLRLLVTKILNEVF
jgi:hypothetical protein